MDNESFDIIKGVYGQIITVLLTQTNQKPKVLPLPSKNCIAANRSVTCRVYWSNFIWECFNLPSLSCTEIQNPETISCLFLVSESCIYGYSWHILPFFEDLSWRRHQPFPSPYPFQDSIGLRSSAQHIPSIIIAGSSIENMLGIPIWNGLLTYKVCIANSIRWIGYFQIFTQPCYDWPETFYSMIFWGGRRGGPLLPPDCLKLPLGFWKSFPWHPFRSCTVQLLTMLVAIENNKNSVSIEQSYQPPIKNIYCKVHCALLWLSFHFQFDLLL